MSMARVRLLEIAPMRLGAPDSALPVVPIRLPVAAKSLTLAHVFMIDGVNIASRIDDQRMPVCLS